MNEKDIKHRILTEARRDVPDLKQAILAHAKAASNTKHKTSIFKLRRFQYGFVLSSLLLFAFVFVTMLNVDYDEYSTLYIDINPSFEIHFNDQNDIQNVITLSNEAELLMEDLPDYNVTDLDTYLDLIIDLSIDKGYLSESSPYIMIDILNQNNERQDHMIDRMETRIPEHAQNRIPNIEIVRGNAMRPDHDIDPPGHSDEMSPQRARLINMIVSETDYHYDDLASLNMGELVHIARENNIDINPGRGPN